MSNRDHGRGGYNEQSFPTVTPDVLKKIIQGENAVESARLTVEWGEKVGKASQKDVTGSQIRIIFTTVRFIEAEWTANASEVEAQQALRQFILLKSKLRYQAERQSKLRDITGLLTNCIDLVNTREQFLRFVDFFEAILAYHKTTGGKS